MESAISHSSRILIVDDQEGDRRLMREAMVDVGWTVTLEEAASRSQALAMLSGHAADGGGPELILMDFQLNGGNCLELIRSIRSMDGHGDTPILVCSVTMPPRPSCELCFELGVLKIIMKAFDYPSHLRMIRMLKQTVAGNGNISSTGAWLGHSD
jgi:CheY-like chemotaxis protein